MVWCGVALAILRLLRCLGWLDVTQVAAAVPWTVAARFVEGGQFGRRREGRGSGGVGECEGMVPTGVEEQRHSSTDGVAKTMRSHLSRAQGQHKQRYRRMSDGDTVPSSSPEGGEGGGMDAEAAGRKMQRRRRRRRRRTRKTSEVVLDSRTRIKRRVKYLLMKMRVDQNLLDAYSGEGWKGQR